MYFHRDVNLLLLHTKMFKGEEELNTSQKQQK